MSLSHDMKHLPHFIYQNIVGYVGQAGGVAAAICAKTGKLPRELAGACL